jgi:hypothetical protein
MLSRSRTPDGGDHREWRATLPGPQGLALPEPKFLLLVIGVSGTFRGRTSWSGKSKNSSCSLEPISKLRAGVDPL